MSKRPSRLREQRKRSVQQSVNPRLGAQTRKVLQQHYRAKHGVK
jgi:hypothetical protein